MLIHVRQTKRIYITDGHKNFISSKLWYSMFWKRLIIGKFFHIRYRIKMFIEHQTMKTWWKWRYGSPYSSPLRWTEVSRERQAPTALLILKTIEEPRLLALEGLWSVGKRKKPAQCWKSNLGRRVRSLVTIPTDLWNLTWYFVIKS
jgi:hypothetical protein